MAGCGVCDDPVTFQVADLLALPPAWESAFDLVAELYSVQARYGQARGAAIRALPGLVAPGGYPQKRSNSPFLTPPRKSCHSPEVNRRTGPPESLLLRTPISPSGRLATSTQLPLA